MFRPRALLKANIFFRQMMLKIYIQIQAQVQNLTDNIQLEIDSRE